MNYLPPPAQAQAQPAQAQAQAQPPPPPLQPLPDDFDTGIGLVLFVILLVKSLRLPTTLLEKSCTPVTTLAANALPGRVGIDAPPPPFEGTETVVFGMPGDLPGL